MVSLGHQQGIYLMMMMMMMINTSSKKAGDIRTSQDDGHKCYHYNYSPQSARTQERKFIGI
jgi:hypothetical protein